MYKHMTLEVFERFNRAAEAYADIAGESRWHSYFVLEFYNWYMEGYVKNRKKLPARCTVVYVSRDAWGKCVNTCLVELQKVKITEKSIVFDDGYVLPFSKIKFFVW